MLWGIMDSDLENAYGLAVRYLARRARTCFEMQQYLSQKRRLDSQIVSQVIDRLLHQGYLDDADFARQFIADRIRFKPKSCYALGYELKAKGVKEAVIAELLDALNDMDLALKAAFQRQDQWQRLDPENRKKKLMNYLRYRGFDYGTCLGVWEKLFPEA